MFVVLLPCYVHSKSFVYLSNHAKHICEDTEGYSYEARFRLIRALDGTISMGDMEHYLDFLERPFKEGSLQRGELNTLKNDLADKLLMQRRYPEDLADRFLKMVDHKTLGIVWRDYVLQKLPDLYERVEKDERIRILEKLWEKADDTHHTFSGTALLGLSRLSSHYPDAVASNQLAEKALAVVKGVEFPEQNKLTALQILAEARHPEVLNLARETLNTDSSVMLRVSAIGVLGLVGQSVDREILSAYAKSPEYRLRRAAEAALERLDE